METKSMHRSFYDNMSIECYKETITGTDCYLCDKMSFSSERLHVEHCINMHYSKRFSYEVDGKAGTW